MGRPACARNNYVHIVVYVVAGLRPISSFSVCGDKYMAPEQALQLSWSNPSLIPLIICVRLGRSRSNADVIWRSSAICKQIVEGQVFARDLIRTSCCMCDYLRYDFNVKEKRIAPSKERS